MLGENVRVIQRTAVGRTFASNSGGDSDLDDRKKIKIFL